MTPGHGDRTRNLWLSTSLILPRVVPCPGSLFTNVLRQNLGWMCGNPQLHISDLQDNELPDNARKFNSGELHAANSTMTSVRMHDSCPEDWMCVPSSSAVQRVSTLRGLQEFTVVEGCECRERPPICTRESSSLLLHPGTPYEMRLDVGVCSGHCQLGGCRPLRNKTVTVPGPNGAECHSVIEQCACAGSCYRTSYMETVYDYVDTDEPLVKEIDVGRCVGSCSGADTRKCVFRDKKNPGKCMAGLYGKQTSCTPSQFKVNRYSDKEKRTKEVISITACKCL
ncbi:unnamed protein product [Timema podura]|uniref:CTCK domain-containing protein n=1 Tax=Timema podura TaxID=61482 RepID=A0ABN7NWF9_TIMPD|nr:unnamed protein product [Timema podura]